MKSHFLRVVDDGTKYVVNSYENRLVCTVR